MTGCNTCGGFGTHHDPIAHDAEERVMDEPCITDWLCLPGAHLRFGECIEADLAGAAAFRTCFGDRRCDLADGHDGVHIRNDACGRPEYYWRPSVPPSSRAVTEGGGVMERNRASHRLVGHR